MNRTLTALSIAAAFAAGCGVTHLLRPALAAEEIGVSLTDEDQLDPEQSTSAIVVTHPQAKYFSV